MLVYYMFCISIVFNTILLFSCHFLPSRSPLQVHTLKRTKEPSSTLLLLLLLLLLPLLPLLLLFLSLLPAPSQIYCFEHSKSILWPRILSRSLNSWLRPELLGPCTLALALALGSSLNLIKKT